MHPKNQRTFGQNKKLALILTVLVGVLCGWFDVQSATYTWSGADGASASTGSNWTPVGPPSVGDRAVFDSSTANTNCAWDITDAMSVLLMEANFDGVVTTSSKLVITDSLVLESGELSLGDSLDLNGHFWSDGLMHCNGHVVLVAGNWTGVGSGGFNDNNNTVVFDGSGAQTLISGGAGARKDFYNLVVDKPSGTLTLSTDLLDVQNDLTIVAGTLDAAGLEITIGGNWDNDGTFTSGANTVTFYGTSKQILLTRGSAEAKDFNNLVIASSDTVEVAGWTVVTDVDLTVSSGVLNLNGNILEVAGSFTVETGASFLAPGGDTVSITGLTVDSGGVYRHLSSGSMTIGADGVGNNGTVFLDANNTSCDGGSDAITIASSSGGTQRSWSGSGTFTIYDVTVSDQAGSASITAQGSSDDGGNGLNWTINASCSPTETFAFNSQITINTAADGANVTGGVADFPLLVRLTSDNFDFTQTQNDGADVRFADSAGNWLTYEIERWDSTAGLAEIWVKVDTIYGNRDDQYIQMHWGNSGAADSSSASSVFAPAGKFLGVWHMDETPGTDASAADATGNGNDLTIADMESGDHVSGLAGYGLEFDGTDDHLIRTSLSSDISANMTYMGWVLVSSADAGDRLWEFPQDASYGIDCRMITVDTIGHDDAGGPGAKQRADEIVSDGEWHHIAVVRSGSTYELIVDGTSDGSLTGTAPTYTKALVGARSFNGDITTRSSFFSGTIDELRIDTTARSSDWVKLCYETQKPNSAVISIIAESDTVGLAELTMRSTTTACSLYTDRWSLVFDQDKGAGICFLSDQTQYAGINQVNDNENLFSILYNGVESSSRTDGVLTLIDSTDFSARIRQEVTLSGELFTTDYTVYGSGKMYIRTWVDGAVASNTLGFRVNRRNSTGTNQVIPATATASSCPYVLLANNSTTVHDILMVPYRSMAGFAFDSSSTADPSYAGWSNSSYSLAAGDRDAFEFMVDFAHKAWNDTSSATGQAANDYRNRDSLEYLVGTMGLDRAWEEDIIGHWNFDDARSDTAGDFSGGGRDGAIYGSSSVTGRIGTGLQMDGTGDTVIVAQDAIYTDDNGFVVALWIKPSTALDAADVLFMVGDDSGTMDGYKVTGGTGGVVQFTAGNGASELTVTGATGIGTGTWHHVAVHCNAATDSILLYVDGEVDAISGSSISVGTGTHRIEIGTNYAGILDDIRMYGRDLWSEDIAMLSTIGYRTNDGRYALRADNNNTIQFNIDGGTYNRHYPVFHLTNYWATDADPVLYVNQTRWTNTASDTMYRVTLDDHENLLIVGLDSVLTSDGLTIYIDDGNDSSAVWETDPVDSVYSTVNANTIVVKNFSGDNLGADGSDTWALVIDRDCGTTTSQGCGGITDFYSSEVDASTAWSSATNLVTSNYMLNPVMWEYGGVAARDSTWGSNVASSGVLSIVSIDTNDVYTRVLLDTVDIDDATNSLSYTRQYTIYPTGKVFELFTVTGANKALDTLFPGIAMAGPSGNDTLVNDDFNRSDNAALGGVWTETEDVSNYVEISGNIAQCTSADGTMVPMFETSFSEQTSGVVVWEFDMNWSRTNGSEGEYEVFMQLGNGMTTDLVTGVAVSLRWGDQKEGFTADEGFGYVASNGTETMVTTISGAATIRVEIDIDNETYDIYVDDVSQATNVAFRNASTTIDEMRFLVNALNSTNFSGENFDNVLLYGEGAVWGTDTLKQHWNTTDNRLTGMVHTGTGSTYHGIGAAFVSYEDGTSGVSSSSLIDDTLSKWNQDPLVLRTFTQGTGTYFQTANLPYFAAFYYDISTDVTTGGAIQTAMFDALYPTCVSYLTGTKVTSDYGDLNADGFNEAEGCYVVAASENTIKMGLGVSCGNASQINSPAFKVANYTSSQKPEYVFLHSKDLGAGDRDTIRLREGYDYSAHVDQTSRQLMIQLDSVFTDSTYLYLSDDDALAVQAGGFRAVGGNGSDTLFWSTESEHENLGFMLYRRIKPVFLDSLFAALDTGVVDTTSNAVALAKMGGIDRKDTAWVPVYEELIDGAPGGTSPSKRTYKVIDYGVHNDVLYQYKLVAVDFDGTKEAFQELAEAMPRVRLPRAFALFHNYPNPFRHHTFIRYNLPIKTDVLLYVYDMRGRLVRRLVRPEGKQNPGFYRITWDGTDEVGRELGTGPYIYHIRANAGKFVKSGVMLLVK